MASARQVRSLDPGGAFAIGNLLSTFLHPPNFATDCWLLLFVKVVDDLLRSL